MLSSLLILMKHARGVRSNNSTFVGKDERRDFAMLENFDKDKFSGFID